MTGRAPREVRPADVAVHVVRTLREAGHEAYLVGGCVREMLLGLEPKDHDVTTDASPEQVEALFPHTVAVGRRFGVMTVIGPGAHVEVATFRTEEGYSDGRRPDSVAFATAEEDVSRRDFTINALLHDPLSGEVIDHVGGRRDLERGLIRTVGDPVERLEEDHLRLLRAVRFTARLGFRLEHATREAVVRHAANVRDVSPERLRDELGRMLEHPTRGRAVSLLRELGLMGHVLPEISAGEGDEAASIGAVAALPAAVSPAVAWAALLRGTARRTGRAIGVAARDAARRADPVLRRLRHSNRLRKDACWLLAAEAEPRSLGTLGIARRRRLVAEDLAPDLALLAEAGARADGADLEEVAAFGRAVREREELPPPLVTGDDLQAAGVPAGPEYARLLDRLRDEQLEGRLATRAEALARLEELLTGGE